MSVDSGDSSLLDGWRRFPAWKRWGFLGLFAAYWLLRLLQYAFWGKPFVFQVLWRGLRPPEELPWVLLAVGLELSLVVALPLWYTAVALRIPDVCPEPGGLRLRWPLPRREQFVGWSEVRGVEPTLAFSWVDLSAGGAWLQLHDGARIPVSYGVRDGVRMVDALKRRFRAPPP